MKAQQEKAARIVSPVKMEGLSGVSTHEQVRAAILFALTHNVDVLMTHNSLSVWVNPEKVISAAINKQFA